MDISRLTGRQHRFRDGHEGWSLARGRFILGRHDHPGALTDWLDRYEQAWRTNDADQIRELFTEDAVYRWHPWEDPADGADGREEIVEAWLEQPDEPDDWTLDCEAARGRRRRWAWPAA